MIEELLREKMFRAQWGNQVHLYWKNQRWTLCGQDKSNRLRVYDLDPSCRKCLAVVGEIVFDQMRRERLVA